MKRLARSRHFWTECDQCGEPLQKSAAVLFNGLRLHPSCFGAALKKTTRALEAALRGGAR